MFGDKDKKQFFQNDLKKNSFSSSDIYVDMEYSELGEHSKILTCCDGACKYKGLETLV